MALGELVPVAAHIQVEHIIAGVVAAAVEGLAFLDGDLRDMVDG